MKYVPELSIQLKLKKDYSEERIGDICCSFCGTLIVYNTLLLI